MAAITFS